MMESISGDVPGFDAIEKYMARHIDVLKVSSSPFAKVIVIVFALISFPLHSWSSNEERSEWNFYKVSSVNVFGSVDKNISTHLEKIYSGLHITTNNGVLTINNDILENRKVCSIKYATMKITALSYYYSNKTVELYKRLFSTDGFSFPDNLEVLTSLNPDDACPTPFSELIKVDNFLVFTDKDFVLYLQEKELIKDKADGFEEKSDISDYCHNTEQQKEFDGTDETTCFFERMTLQEAYSTLLGINKYARKYLRSDLPSSDLIYKKDNTLIHYNWVGNEKFNIKLNNDGEVFLYSFYLVDNGTQLRIKEVTDY